MKIIIVTIMNIEKDYEDNEKYVFNIHKISEEAVRLSQRESGTFVFSKLHRFLFTITKHLRDIILEFIQ